MRCDTLDGTWIEVIVRVWTGLVKPKGTEYESRRASTGGFTVVSRSRPYTSDMRHFTLAVGMATLLIALPAWAQTRTPMKPAAPGTSGDPVWQGTLRMSDGRTFVTDGGLAVDAAFAKPAALPTRELPARILEDYMKASHKNEYGFEDLTLAATGNTYTAPSGIALNATYIKYLRRVAPRGARLRMTEPGKPIVVVADAKPIAVLMPVKQ